MNRRMIMLKIRQISRTAAILLIGFLLAILFVFFLLEIGMRYLEKTDRLPPVSRCLSFGTRMGISYRADCKEEVLDARGQKSQVHYNSDGLIGSLSPSSAVKGKGRYNILLLGDCIIEEKEQVVISKRLDSRLIKNLEKESLSPQIYLAAKASSSLQSLRILIDEKIPLSSFDLVILVVSRPMPIDHFFDRMKTKRIHNQDWIIHKSILHSLVGDRFYFLLASYTKVPRALFFLGMVKDLLHARFFISADEISDLFVRDLEFLQEDVAAAGAKFSAIYMHPLKVIEATNRGMKNKYVHKESLSLNSSANLQRLILGFPKLEEISRNLIGKLSKMGVLTLDSSQEADLQSETRGKLAPQEIDLLVGEITKILRAKMAKVPN